jgi:DNA polymerase I
MAAPLPAAPRVINWLEDIERLVRAYIARGTPVSFDIETTGLDPRTDKLVMIQLQQQDKPVIVIDCRQFETEVWWGEEIGDDVYYLGQTLAPLFNGSVLIVGHNLKFDLGFARYKFGVRATRIYDTMIAEQVIHGVGKSSARKQGIGLTLKSVAANYDVSELSKEERSWFIDLDQREEWNQDFPDEQLLYGARDVEVLQPIADLQKAELRRRNLIPVAQLEMRVLPALVEVEHAGVHVDVSGWRAFIEDKRAEAAELEKQAVEVFGPPILAQRAAQYDMDLVMWEAWDAARITQETKLREEWGQRAEKAGWGAYKLEWMKEWRKQFPNPGKPKADTGLVNLGSHQQLLVAFEALGIPVPTKRDPKTGVEKQTTSADALSLIEDDYPALQPLGKWRKAEKFVDSFGENLLAFVASDGRIHPEFQQIGADTGRESCTRPNWQQIPSKGDGKRLRALVTAEPGNVILTADFSNIELRILADMSGDVRMLEMFAAGMDLHSYTAQMMFALDDTVDVAHEEAFPGVTYRAVAKTINFGLVYGMSATKLARTLKISREKAAELMEVYFSLYPGVARWLEQQRSFGVEEGYSLTLSGRKRFYKLPTEPIRPASRDTEVIEQWLEERKLWKGQLHRIQRQACNSPIQGTSADITKLAHCLIHESYQGEDSLRDVARVVAIVHDEFVVEVPADQADQAARTLAECMGAAAEVYLHKVALPTVQVAIADHWSKE